MYAHQLRNIGFIIRLTVTPESSSPPPPPGCDTVTLVSLSMLDPIPRLIGRVVFQVGQ